MKQLFDRLTTLWVMATLTIILSGCSAGFEANNSEETTEESTSLNENNPTQRSLELQPGIPEILTSATDMVFAIDATQLEGDRLECRLDIGFFGPCQSDAQHSLTNLPSGVHTFTVRLIGEDGTGLVKNHRWTVDADSPTLTITSNAASIINTTSLTAQINFNEDVSTLTQGQIQVQNGTITSFVRQSSSQYNLDIEVTAEGVVQVIIPAGVVRDGAGNPSLASNTFTREYQRLARSLALTLTPASTATPTNQTQLMFNFNGSFVSGDTYLCSLDGAAPTACASPITHDQLADGNHSFTVTLETPLDGNISRTFNWTVDTVRPAPTLLSASPNTISTPSFTARLNFSENISGFDATDLTTSNCSISGVTTVDPQNIDLQVSIAAPGSATVTIPANVVVDMAQNGNTGPVSISRTYTAPTQSINIGWDAVTEDINDNPIAIGGYRIYYGTSSRNYTQSIDVGDNLMGQISGLGSGQSYYITVVAYDMSDNESAYGQELVYNSP